MSQRERGATTQHVFDVLDALHVHARAGLAAQAIGALIVGLLCFRTATPWACLGWIGGWVAACVLRWHALRRYRGRSALDQWDEQRALRSWDAANLVGGALWGAAALLFFPKADASVQIGLTVLVCSLCLVLPASTYRAYGLTAALGFLPLTGVVLGSEAHAASLAAVLLLVWGSALLVGHAYRTAFQQVFMLKDEAEGLARQLAIEKRRVEEATLSRSRYYTAASHDLRQPLQSLVILGESLERQPLPPQAAEQAAQLAQAVRALERLFDALIDLGQLDAGAVRARMAPVRLEPVFRRIGLHWRTTAFDRGLSLDFRGGEHAVLADPVLLERVLRNLVANAVGCTVDGGVLVTCRPRGASQCLLQVWDTGPGIAPEVLPRIFDEFYRGPAPSSERGLGLGLTIARALTRLMGSSLAVRSAVGRGTVFSLVLPRVSLQHDLPAGDTSTFTTLAGQRIVVFTEALPPASQVIDQLRLWHADAMPWPSDEPPPWSAEAAPDVLVVGALPLEAQQRLLARCERCWSAAVPALLLMAPAGHPVAAWPRQVHLSQPLAAHRLRSALIALQSMGPRPD